MARELTVRQTATSRSSLPRSFVMWTLAHGIQRKGLQYAAWRGDLTARPVAVHRLAVPLHLRRLVRPPATSRQEPVLVDLHVPPHADRAVLPRADEGALVCLVRRLVGAEPHVAVRPEELGRPELGL